MKLPKLRSDVGADHKHEKLSYIKKGFGRLYLLILGLILFTAVPSVGQSLTSSSDSTTYLMIRADDIGMSHSVNMALKELLDTGYPVSASIMFPTPWHKEAVALVKEYDNVSVGIHLTLNSEWEYYRWGPITGREAVPSLVDKDGYFYHTTEPMKNNPPRRDEIEKELRAQIERALKTGLRIDYVDYHMGVMGIPGFRKVAQQLAREYNLGMWGDYDSDRWASHYSAAPEDKPDSLVTMVNQMKPGYNYLMTHIGIDNAELGAMKDMNSTGSLSVEMSQHRQGELDALTSDAFAKALKEKNIKLITFKDLMDVEGVEGIERFKDVTE